jgi:hypothetical protein
MEGHFMFGTKSTFLMVLLVALLFVTPVFSQQKGQYIPGQGGLNAGVMPDPGITLGNLTINYSANSLRDQAGNNVNTANGTYSIWAVETIVAYVPKGKFIGGKFMSMAYLPFANGSVVADFGHPPAFPVNAGGAGYADSFLIPAAIGWNLKHVDQIVGYGLMAPTGRYTPGASNNIGSGYWGNNIITGTTVYLTKNKGTTANLSTDWEIHGSKNVVSDVGNIPTKITPGQAYTIEWGLGQMLPLDKQMTKILQIGFTGYDQWQVSPNNGYYIVGGTPTPASKIPWYSVHAMGFQTNFLAPTKGLVMTFKYLPEYKAYARPQGRTIVFGATWTLRIPKPAPPAKP